MQRPAERTTQCGECGRNILRWPILTGRQIAACETCGLIEVQRASKITAIFVMVYVLAPIVTGLISYKSLPDESFNPDRHTAMLTEDYSEGTGPIETKSGLRVTMWRNSSTGEVFTSESFSEHRQAEGYRIFTIWLLYGLIGCFFYAGCTSWQDNYRGFATHWMKAQVVNIGIALFMLVGLR